MENINKAVKIVALEGIKKLLNEAYNTPSDDNICNLLNAVDYFKEILKIDSPEPVQPTSKEYMYLVTVKGAPEEELNYHDYDNGEACLTFDKAKTIAMDKMNEVLNKYFQTSKENVEVFEEQYSDDYSSIHAGFKNNTTWYDIYSEIYKKVIL